MRSHIGAFRNEYKADHSFMESGTYCRVVYCSNHVTSEGHHLEQDTQIVYARNRNYEATLGANGDHQRQMKYSASHHSLPPPKNRPQKKASRAAKQVAKLKISTTLRLGVKSFILERSDRTFFKRCKLLRTSIKHCPEPVGDLRNVGVGVVACG